jgi:hypothetical protein
MADVIKIDLTNNNHDWDNFVEKTLTTCINYNKTIKEGFRYGIKYYGDDLDICLFRYDENEAAWNEINGVGIDQETYESGNRTDKDIIESLFNTIQSKMMK